MTTQKLSTDNDQFVSMTDFAMVEQLGDAVLLGNWFVFLKAEWLQRSGLERLLEQANVAGTPARSAIVFRGKETITLPGARIVPTPLPTMKLVSLTCDKALYRAKQDTVRLLIAAPQIPRAELRLRLRLSGNPYGDYPVKLDEFGLYLWSLQGLPEGEYEASLEGSESTGAVEADVCRFEVAEYRLAPLNAELSEQQLSGETLRYVLTVTAFGQPYSGAVEVELQERGQRVGNRTTLHCNREGQCRGAVKLTGKGPYTLNVFAGERTATVAVKGSEQERRETITISELGEIRVLSLLPLPQSNVCRGMYVARGGSNTEPFIVRRVIGNEVEIIARVAAELLRVVVVDPARHTFEEKLYENVKAEQSIRQPVAAPYGIVLLGAFVEGNAWEGWSTILRPPELQVQCAAPKEAKPGERITVTLKTNMAERAVPVQLIVKDQRLIASSDPLVEFAACMKKNLQQWSKLSGTGEIERQLAQLRPGYPYPYQPTGRGFAGPRIMATMASGAVPPPPSAIPFGAIPTMAPMTAPMMPSSAAQLSEDTGSYMAPQAVASVAQKVIVTAPTVMPQLAKIRLQFPEILYNKIVPVQGEASIEVKLGDSMTRYSIEAFALDAETLDWQRVETTLNATQAVYGELTVSPFVFPGDPVMGRLDVGAASGGAIVEVRHDGEVLPLFYDNGEAVTSGLPIPSGSVLRFPVRPGAITATVRDARKGGIDVSERYVTEPGKLRHIARRLHLLTPGEEMTLQEPLRLEIMPLPGLEKPFQFFVEGAANYPFGCIEQSSCKLLSMVTGYITNGANAAVAREYEAAIPIWYQRIKSMYLPNSGFCMYPPSEGGARKPDTHYAPMGTRHLLSLPSEELIGEQSQAVREMLADIRTMAQDAARYYKIEYPPKAIKDCQSAYQVLIHGGGSANKEQAAAFVRSRLAEHAGQVYVDVPEQEMSYHWCGKAVATRKETAYAAAALLATKQQSDLRLAIAATNYLTGQFNEEGRLYSTVDTAACLALLLGLRESGVVSTAGAGKVVLNGQEMTLAEALAYEGKAVETLRCVEGVVAAQVTSEVVEDWGALQRSLPVTVRLEKNGQVQKSYKVGDALDLVISVSQYEPGLIAHVCLPDALARVVGGGQVKRFSLDFLEKNTLRVPVAVVSATNLPTTKDEEQGNFLLRWLGIGNKRDADQVQHWAVLVRNMFKEEVVGNPGLLEVRAV